MRGQSTTAAVRSPRQPGVRVAWDRSGNLGDELTPLLFPRLTGRPILPTSYAAPVSKILAIGSILHRATPTAVVWGSGLIGPSHAPRHSPLRIAAVRGPLTRRALIERGFSCPAVYGDPAILLPLIFAPSQRKRYRVGLLPHYVDATHPWVRRFDRYPNSVVIHARKCHHDVAETIQRICACELLITSSLHGLILADAYGVPSLWVSLSGRVLGDGFKFRDYFASLESPFIGATHPHPVPIIVTCNTRVDALIAMESPPRPVRQLWPALLQACPVAISLRIMQASRSHEMSLRSPAIESPSSVRDHRTF